MKDYVHLQYTRKIKFFKGSFCSKEERNEITSINYIIFYWVQQDVIVTVKHVYSYHPFCFWYNKFPLVIFSLVFASLDLLFGLFLVSYPVTIFTFKLHEHLTWSNI